MENLLLEEEEQIQVPELKVFRDFVDHLRCRKREEIYIKLSYLLAARASELLTKVTPYMLQHNMSKPYGKLLDWSFSKTRIKTRISSSRIWTFFHFNKQTRSKKDSAYLH